MYYKTNYLSPVGPLTLASDGVNLVGLWMDGQKYFGDSVAGEMHAKDDLPIFKAAKKWLDRYFAGEKPKISELALAPAGNAFRQEVWRILCQIPYGQVMTYGEIARKIAACTAKARMSAQAVGGAVGRNPISIIIPCHRVMGAAGNLTGYSGGINKKIQLLQHERADMTGFFTPKKSTAP